MKRDNLKFVLPGLLISFTFFIFGTVDMFFSNYTEFWFSVSDFILPCILCCILAAAVFAGGAFLLNKRSKKACSIYLALLLGLGVALYLQGNYLVIDYGVLNGQEILWENYHAYGGIDTLVWIVCLALPLFALRFKPGWFENVVRYVPAFILAVQVITLGTLFMTHDFTKESRAVLTEENQFEFSKEKNTVVFVVDCLDAEYMNKMLEEYPDVKDSIRDFTYYTDTVGAFSTTQGALPFLMTGTPYHNEQPYKDYLHEAFLNSPVLDAAENNGYEVDYYTTASVISSSGVGRITNLIFSKTVVSDMPNFMKTYFQLIGFRYAPHYMKPAFWMASNDFDSYMDIASSQYPVYSLSNMQFLNNVEDSEFHADREAPVLKLYHLFGVHAPLSLDENLNEVDSNETTQAKQARACFRIIDEFIKKLKDIGLYDSTSITIMADHGSANPQWPSFLVKTKGESHEEMRMSEYPFSYLADWTGTLDSLMKESWDNEISYSGSRARMFNFYTWSNWYAEYLPEMYEYRITGKAKDMDLEKDKTGVVFYKNVEGDYSYQLGGVIDTNEDDFKLYAIKYGAEVRNDTGSDERIVLSDHAQLRLKLAEIPHGDQLMRLGFAQVYPKWTTFEAKINGKSLGEQLVVQDTEELIFKIPDGTIDSQELVLDFLAPGAKDVNWPVPLSVDLSEIQINADDGKSIEPPLPVLTEDLKLDYSNGAGDSDKILLDNKWAPAKDYFWTGKEVKYLFCVDTQRDMLFRIKYDLYYFGDGTEAIITLNDKEVGRLTEEKGTAEIILPKEILNSQNYQILELYCPDAVSPAKLTNGENQDVRELGMLVTSVEFLFDKTGNDDFDSVPEEPTVVEPPLPVLTEDLKLDYRNGDGDSDKILLDNEWEPGPEYLWTGKETKYLFRVDTQRDLLFRLHYDLYYFDDGTEAVITLNGEEVGRLTEKQGTAEIILPKEFLRSQDRQVLEIYCPDAVSPAELTNGENQDVRELGMLVTSVEFLFDKTGNDDFDDD